VSFSLGKKTPEKLRHAGTSEYHTAEARGIERVGNNGMPKGSPLFCRLHGCIQAAASKLHNFNVKNTKRVEILVHLIPKELPREIGKSRDVPWNL
jgi:poly(3-hydroxybutyrate) depolymerase